VYPTPDKGSAITIESPATSSDSSLAVTPEAKSQGLSHLGWRIAIPLAILFVALNIGSLKYVRDAYPSDPFKRMALTHCIASDAGFVRFFASDREACYTRQPQMPHLFSADSRTPGGN
jgi:hypothetical protein